MVKPRTFAIFALSAVLVLAAACLLDGCRRTGKKVRHVVLISIDTCRADYLGCYGFGRPTTPNIDAMAAEGVLFRNAVAAAPLTLPSHSTMLTGTIPPYHGVHDNSGYRLDESNTTLAEILKEDGYATGGIVAIFILDSDRGIAQGFDYYNDDYEEPNRVDLARGRIAEESSTLACEWLSAHKDEPFFLFLHYYDPHTPYEPPEPFAGRFADDLYAGEICYTDFQLGRVFDKLKELGIYDSTLIILTGDHGEMLGEHGETTHGYFIYESAIKVPLIVKRPYSTKHLDVSDTVGLIDIVPTVCSMAGVEAPSPVHGEDLSAYWSKRSKKATRYLYTESMVPMKSGAASLLGVVSGDFKYIQTTRPELYDTAEDPNETQNLIYDEPKLAHLLKEHLKLILTEQVREDTTTSQVKVSGEFMQQLESLGYIGGLAEASFDFDQGRKAPKDLIGFHELQREYRAWQVKKQLKRAKEVALKMLAEQPDYVGAYCMLAEVSKDLGQTEAALGYLSSFFARVKSEQQDPAARELLFKAHDISARMYFERGNFADAAKHWSEALAIDPKDAGVCYNLAVALVGQVELESAVSQFEQAIRLDPNRPETHRRIADAFTALQKPDEAEKHLRTSLELAPGQPEVLNLLSKALVRQHKMEEAIQYWQQVVALEPDNYEVHHNLAVACEGQGKFGNAIEHWKKVLQLKPDKPELLKGIGRALDAQTRMEDAVRYWQQVVELTPDNYEVHHSLAMAFEKQGEHGKAIEHWEKVLQLKPAQPAVHDKLANLYYLTGSTDDAVRHWNEAVKLKPDWPEVLNNLAWIKASDKTGRFADPNEAIGLAEKACELTEYGNPGLLDTLSVCYEAAGRTAEAIDVAHKAIELAQAQNQQQLADNIKKRLAALEQSKPE